MVNESELMVKLGYQYWRIILETSMVRLGYPLRAAGNLSLRGEYAGRLEVNPEQSENLPPSNSIC